MALASPSDLTKSPIWKIIKHRRSYFANHPARPYFAKSPNENPAPGTLKTLGFVDVSSDVVITPTMVIMDENGPWRRVGTGFFIGPLGAKVRPWGPYVVPRWHLRPITTGTALPSRGVAIQHVDHDSFEGKIYVDPTWGYMKIHDALCVYCTFGLDKNMSSQLAGAKQIIRTCYPA